MKNFFTDPMYHVEALVLSIPVVVSLVLVVYTWFQPWAYRHTSDGIGIAAFPTVFLVGIIFFGIICFVSDFIAFRRGVNPGSTDVTAMDWTSTYTVSAIAILSPLTIFLIDPLFYVAVLCFLILIIGRVRKPLLLIIPTIGIVAFIYIFMIEIADVFFPVTWFF
jgi:hypothetical protein